MSLFLVVSTVQEYKILADQNQQLLDISNANDWVTPLAQEALVGV
jgi:hypothetical protein